MNVEIICLYLKGYISCQIFEKLLFDNLNVLKKIIDEDILYELITANYNSKEQKMHVNKVLKEYIFMHYFEIYETITDAYVDRIVDSDRKDYVANILRKQYEKRNLIEINCNMICTHDDFIKIFKEKMSFPLNCGNNWDAINDYIFDIIFPVKLKFIGWEAIEKKFPKDTEILKNILGKIDMNRCMIFFE